MMLKSYKNKKRRVVVNDFKKVMFYLVLFLTFNLKTEDIASQLKNLEQSIKCIEVVIADVAKNLTAQKKIFALLQKQFESSLALDTDTENDSEEDEEETEAINIKAEDDDHRLTLRIPKILMAKIDKKRKLRIGKISRNLWILEVLERATKK